MRSSTLSGLAGSTLIVVCWMTTIVAQPGANFLAAIVGGAASLAFVRLVLAAVRADARERFLASVGKLGGGERR